MKTTKQGDPKLAVATVRVSTEDQNLGPEAQRAAIRTWAERNGVQVISWHEDRLSGATPVEDRPGLLGALQAIRERGAGVLVAAKRDRLARSVAVAATIETLATEAGARVLTADGVAADEGPEGELLRTLLDAFAAYERSLIRARTRAALQAKKRRGERLGRPRKAVDANLVARVREMRKRGLSWARTAALLSKQTRRPVHVTSLVRLLERAA
jgi:DNA invertase Pin-like site-specific DNA recombinase